MFLLEGYQRAEKINHMQSCGITAGAQSAWVLLQHWKEIKMNYTQRPFKEPKIKQTTDTHYFKLFEFELGLCMNSVHVFIDLSSLQVWD